MAAIAGEEGVARRVSASSTARALAMPIALALLIGGVFVKKGHENAAEIAGGRERIERALSEEVAELAQRLSIIAGRQGVAIAVPSDRDMIRAWGRGGFDKLFLVDYETGEAVAGGPLIESPQAYAALRDRIAPAIARSRQGVADSLRGLLAEDGERGRGRPVSAQAHTSLFAVDNGDPAMVIVAPFTPPRAQDAADAGVRHALVGVRRFDGGILGRLTQRAGVPIMLHKPHAGNEHEHYAIGGVEEALAWIPGRPGDASADRLLLIIAIFGALYAAVSAMRANRKLSELAVREEAAKRSAGHDLLSGLPNRLMFAQLVDAEAARAARAGGGFAIFYLDLDRFKEINDTHGHGAGDQMIIAMTKRVTDVLRQSDRMSRLGGDEFAILQTDVRDPRDCELLARRILKAMSEPFDLGGIQVMAGVSIGIALSPQNSRDGYELMHLADLALYRAKNEGRNRFCFFETRMGEELRRRRSIEDDLRSAIAEDRLELHYQPVLDAGRDRVVGVEALLRWPHATQGLLRPSEFLGIAEDRGLSLPLGDWALRRACAEAQAWGDLRVSVNISPIHFRNGDFVASVRRVLDETGFDPSRLELEVTEAVLLADAAQAEASILDLCAMGVRVALDDFGCGYASLLYLRRFAFERIKIDRSLLETMEATGESAIIVRTTLELAGALGLSVTAKGVETDEQKRLLLDFGCHEMQGFLLAAPMPASELARFHAARQARTSGARPARLVAIAGGTQRPDM